MSEVFAAASASAPAPVPETETAPAPADTAAPSQPGAAPGADPAPAPAPSSDQPDAHLEEGQIGSDDPLPPLAADASEWEEGEVPRFSSGPMTPPRPAPGRKQTLVTPPRRAVKVRPSRPLPPPPTASFELDYDGGQATEKPASAGPPRSTAPDTGVARVRIEDTSKHWLYYDLDNPATDMSQSKRPRRNPKPPKAKPAAATAPGPPPGPPPLPPGPPPPSPPPAPYDSYRAYPGYAGMTRPPPWIPRSTVAYPGGGGAATRPPPPPGPPPRAPPGPRPSVPTVTPGAPPAPPTRPELPEMRLNSSSSPFIPRAGSLSSSSVPISPYGPPASNPYSVPYGTLYGVSPQYPWPSWLGVAPPGANWPMHMSSMGWGPSPQPYYQSDRAADYPPHLYPSHLSAPSASSQGSPVRLPPSSSLAPTSPTAPVAPASAAATSKTVSSTQPSLSELYNQARGAERAATAAVGRASATKGTMADGQSGESTEDLVEHLASLRAKLQAALKAQEAGQAGQTSPTATTTTTGAPPDLPTAPPPAFRRTAPIPPTGPRPRIAPHSSYSQSYSQIFTPPIAPPQPPPKKGRRGPYVPLAAVSIALDPYNSGSADPLESDGGKRKRSDGTPEEDVHPSLTPAAKARRHETTNYFIKLTGYVPPTPAGPNTRTIHSPSSRAPSATRSSTPLHGAPSLAPTPASSTGAGLAKVPPALANSIAQFEQTALKIRGQSPSIASAAPVPPSTIATLASSLSSTAPTPQPIAPTPAPAPASTPSAPSAPTRTSATPTPTPAHADATRTAGTAGAPRPINDARNVELAAKERQIQEMQTMIAVMERKRAKARAATIAQQANGQPVLGSSPVVTPQSTLNGSSTTRQPSAAVTSTPTVDASSNGSVGPAVINGTSALPASNSPPGSVSTETTQEAPVLSSNAPAPATAPPEAGTTTGDAPNTSTVPSATPAESSNNQLTVTSNDLADVSPVADSKDGPTDPALSAPANQPSKSPNVEVQPSPVGTSIPQKQSAQ